MRNDFVDFHSHILPGIDDGSPDIEMTTEMAEMSLQQGLKHVLATPHFYPDRTDIDTFLNERNKSAQDLKLKGLKIALGAEVGWYPTIGKSESLSKLCINGTETALIEMPFCKWNSSMIDSLVEIRESLHLFPVIAHFERYMEFQKKDCFLYLHSNGVLIQSNASFFLDSRTSKGALALLDDEIIDFIGSDMHNKTTRAQNIGPAIQLIESRLGESAVERICENCNDYLSEAVWIG